MSDARLWDRQRPELAELLDASLRGMVRGEGPADLRQRVLARLEERRPPRALWPAWAAAAVLAAGAAAWWLRPPVEPVRGPSPPTAAEAPRSIPPADPEVTPSAGPAVTSVERVASAAAADTAEPTLPPIPGPPPIELRSLESPQIEIAPLRLAAIEVADLAVEPLDEPEHERMK